jgi:hypothetical protein
MKPKGFYYTRWKPEPETAIGLSEFLYAGVPKLEPETAIGLSRLLYSPPVSTDPVPGSPAINLSPVSTDPVPGVLAVNPPPVSTDPVPEALAVNPPPVITDPVPGAPANSWPAEVNSATEGERAQERRAWLLAKLGGEYSVFELSKTGRISYGGLESWLDGKITNQTPTMRGKLVKALNTIGISCSISEVPW